MRSGKLDRTISIETLVETISPTGAVVTDWDVVARLRAEIVQQSLDEFLTGMGEGSKSTIMFRCRYRAGIQTGDRIVYNSETFKIVQVFEIGRRHGLELRAVSALIEEQ